MPLDVSGGLIRHARLTELEQNGMDAISAFVLDGSVTMVWGFEDEADEYAEAILKENWKATDGIRATRRARPEPKQAPFRFRAFFSISSLTYSVNGIRCPYGTRTYNFGCVQRGR